MSKFFLRLFFGIFDDSGVVYGAAFTFLVLQVMITAVLFGKVAPK